MDFELLDLNETPKTPWKNGAGLMREIAIEPPGADLGAMDWKLSWAETIKDSHFSSFPSIDRSIVLLRGAGLRLRLIDEALNVTFDDPLHPFSFKGEARIHAELIGGPVENLSILLSRERYQASVSWVDTSHDVPAADALFVLCVTGVVRLSRPDLAPIDLRAQQAALWRKGTNGLGISAMPCGGRAVAVGLNRRALCSRLGH